MYFTMWWHTRYTRSTVNIMIICRTLSCVVLQIFFSSVLQMLSVLECLISNFNTLKALTLLVHAVLSWCFHIPPRTCVGDLFAFVYTWGTLANSLNWRTLSRVCTKSVSRDICLTDVGSKYYYHFLQKRAC